MCGKNTRNCVQYFLTLVLFTFFTCCILRCLVCIAVILCVFAVLCVYCCHLMCICCTMCVLLFLLSMPDCWLEVSIRKVLRPATLTQVFRGFRVSINKC